MAQGCICIAINRHIHEVKHKHEKHVQNGNTSQNA